MKRRTGKAMVREAKTQGQRRLHGLQPEGRDLPARVSLGQRGVRAEDAEILRDLRRSARRIGRRRLGASEYRRHGGYSTSTVIRRFGSWNAAVERAGLSAPARASDKQLLADLRRVARQLGRDRLGQTEYNRHGRYNSQMMARRFGSWGKAVERAALGTAGHPHADIEALFYNLLAVWLKLGRRPASGNCAGRSRSSAYVHICNALGHGGRRWRRSSRGSGRGSRPGPATASRNTRPGRSW